jgi:hypothetical protein
MPPPNVHPMGIMNPKLISYYLKEGTAICFIKN